MLKRLPIGSDIFDDVIQNDYYYVDKTMLIKELVDRGSYVSLITRPRRFGKSLNMSMLRHFFRIGSDKTLFDGLKISEDKAFCEKYQGQFPVIAISLKEANCNNFNDTKIRLYTAVGDEASKFCFLLDSDKLNEREKLVYKSLIKINTESKPGVGIYDMDVGVFADSLQKLSYLLYKHYGKKVIILIDEYDVPISHGYYNRYYSDIISLIRNFLGFALKTNEYLKFAVLTGCTRVSKESIFTGLNNFKVFTVADEGFSTYFGFTESEVMEMFKYYGVEDKYNEAKDWYDGFRVGKQSLFASWDVINYVSELRDNPNAKPKNHWAQTSQNIVIQQLLEKDSPSVRDKIETLIAGGTISERIIHDITYGELNDSIEHNVNESHIWSVMLSTGYVTILGEDSEGKSILAIPNKELIQVFKDKVENWFIRGLVKKNAELTQLQKAFLTGDAETAESIFNDFLSETITLRDDMRQEDAKESFYHGILLGLLSSEYAKGCSVKSNQEAGKGYCDICLTSSDRKTGAIIELKLAKSDDEFDSACDEAIEQINSRQYTKVFRPIITKTIYKYGIACRQKYCMIKQG